MLPAVGLFIAEHIESIPPCNTESCAIVLIPSYPESRKIAGFVRLRQGQDMATLVEQLRVGTAYVQTSEMSYGSQVQMYPLE